jgi:hypothetical protein
MLEKVEIVDRIEALDSGVVQVRTKTAIKENGVEISSKFHRHVVAPGDDYSGEDTRVQGVCATLHTPEVVVAYKAVQAARVAQAEQAQRGV